MGVHPQAQVLLDMLKGRPDTSQVSVEEARSAYAPLPVPKPALHSVEDRTLPTQVWDIPVRIYKPGDKSLYPALVYYHGGGWVIGDLDTHDHMCRVVAQAADCAVISVDYRLAPEHKFPAAVLDAYHAFTFLATNGTEYGLDTSRIAVGGDSAGGNLAAVVAQMARNHGQPQIACQLLIYPAVSFRQKTDSIRRFGEGYLLTKQALDWFETQYLNSPEDVLNPLAAPLEGTDLRGLPPAIIVTAEADPLRDQGALYAKCLQESGVRVHYHCYSGMIHDFVRLYAFLDGGKQALRDISRQLQEQFSKVSDGAAHVSKS